MDSTVPQPPSPPRPYASATRPNVRELGLLGLLALLVIGALALPWLLVRLATHSGLDFDTWKAIQPGAPPQYMLPLGAAEYQQTETGTLAVYPDGAWALVEQFPDHKSAVRIWQQRWGRDSWPEDVVSGSTSVGSGQWLGYGKSYNGNLIEWVSGPFILQFFARNDAGLSRLIAGSHLIDARGEPKYGHGDVPLLMRILRVNAVGTAVALDALVLALLGVAWWLLLAGASVKPKPGTARVGRETLRARLLGLNDAALPFTVEAQGSYHLIARLRLDEPAWVQELARQQVNQAWQLDLYLGNSVASALETHGKLVWSVAADGPASAVPKWDYLRKVETRQPRFRMQNSAPGGQAMSADTQPSPTATPKAPPSFHTDFRTLIQQTVLDSGWTWRQLLLRPVWWEWR